MKGLLVFLLLLSFLVNVHSQCKPNEVFDEQAQKCEKFCEEGLVFNQETSTCEVNTTCPEGQTFNNETSTCEEVQIDDQDPNKNPKKKPEDEDPDDTNPKKKPEDEGPDDTDPKKKPEDEGPDDTDPKKKPEDEDPDNSKPKKENNITCKGGKIVGGKCNCPKGKKLVNGECVDDPKKNAKMV